MLCEDGTAMGDVSGRVAVVGGGRRCWRSYTTDTWGVLECSASIDPGRNSHGLPPPFFALVSVDVKQHYSLSRLTLSGCWSGFVVVWCVCVCVCVCVCLRRGFNGW